MKKYDILVTGSLVDTDIIMAEHLSRLGLKAIVVRRRGKEKRSDLPEGYLTSLPEDHIYSVSSPFQFIKLASKSKFLLSITGSLINHLRFLWPLRHLLNLPPIINLTTGSDITEFAKPQRGHQSAKEWLKTAMYRQYLDFVDLNWCLPLPNALENIVNLRLKNVVFMNGFPYIFPSGSTDDIRLPHDKTIHFFHCSHLDWNFTNFSADRNSTKGNDKFIRAFIRACHEGRDVRLSILDRGPDRNTARQMFKQGGVEDKVTWLPQLKRKELYRKILESDVVVNMFGHGGAGGISWEALALGRPVMQYANPMFFDLMYSGNMAPFINCRTDQEIYEKIIWCCETDQLTEIARLGRDWIIKFVAPENSLNKFLFYYSLLTHDIRINFGDFIQEMQQHVEAVRSGAYKPYTEISKQ